VLSAAPFRRGGRIIRPTDSATSSSVSILPFEPVHVDAEGWGRAQEQASNPGQHVVHPGGVGPPPVRLVEVVLLSVDRRRHQALTYSVRVAHVGLIDREQDPAQRLSSAEQLPCPRAVSHRKAIWTGLGSAVTARQDWPRVPNRGRSNPRSGLEGRAAMKALHGRRPKVRFIRMFWFEPAVRLCRA
jgi:hypothetical protein